MERSRKHWSRSEPDGGFAPSTLVGEVDALKYPSVVDLNGDAYCDIIWWGDSWSSPQSYVLMGAATLDGIQLLPSNLPIDGFSRPTSRNALVREPHASEWLVETDDDRFGILSYRDDGTFDARPVVMESLPTRTITVAGRDRDNFLVFVEHAGNLYSGVLHPDDSFTLVSSRAIGSTGGNQRSYDLDGDGLKDFIYEKGSLGGPESELYAFVSLRTNGSLHEPRDLAFPEYPHVESWTPVDIDGDGDLDILGLARKSGSEQPTEFFVVPNLNAPTVANIR